MAWFRPLRGWHVLVMILLFFGVTIAVNATFITLAVRTHPGEDVPRSYMQGVNYNDTLERRQAQAAMGWSARFNRVEGALLVEVLDRSGAAVTELSLEGLIAHPTDTTRDCALVFAETRPGVYQAPIPCEADAGWSLRARNTGARPFEFVSEL
ncbi:FixH family protein [Maricaulis sp.]|uniref:FixH family protein n=1 Tax=Maricaulis sp. TaxID=1486257 RepID=UPI002636083B|nr:FixH family protein [Maricaulis sp.]